MTTWWGLALVWLVGAVTKPWVPNVTFRTLPPERFGSFADPGFMPIRWVSRLPLTRDAERRAGLPRAGVGAHA